MGTVVEGSATPSCIPSTLVAPVEAQPIQLPPHTHTCAHQALRGAPGMMLFLYASGEKKRREDDCVGKTEPWKCGPRRHIHTLLECWVTSRPFPVPSLRPWVPGLEGPAEGGPSGTVCRAAGAWQQHPEGAVGGLCTLVLLGGREQASCFHGAQLPSPAMTSHTLG